MKCGRWRRRSSVAAPSRRGPPRSSPWDTFAAARRVAPTIGVARRSGSRDGAVATTVPVTTVAAVVTAGAAARALVTVTRGAHLDDGLEGFRRRQQLERFARSTDSFAATIDSDADAVEVLLGLDAELVADGGIGGEEAAVDRATRLAGPGGAPGP